MFTLALTETAQREPWHALDWYEGEAQGLALRFSEAVDAATERMKANPRQFPLIYGPVRRAVVHRFPYVLLFEIYGDTLNVIACFHTSRNPRRWQRRI